jgi:phosphoglycolate phosphatase
VYKKRYLDLVDTRIADRLDEPRQDRSAASKYLVPGSVESLEALRERGLTLYLASGADQDYIRREAALLGVTPFFNGGVFGALDDYKSFSKKMLIEKIIAGSECRGHEILAFGDGYVEIENVKAVGGIAVGVASDEPECRKVDEWKRDRLAGVGADYIIPHLLCRAELFDHLFTA